MTIRALVVLAMLVVLAAVRPAHPASHPDPLIDAAQAVVDPADLVFVTDEEPLDWPGCDAISIFDSATGQALYRGSFQNSRARLAVDSDFDVVIAAPSSNWGPRFGFLNMLVADRAEPTGWRPIAPIKGASFAPWGGILILPDDNTVLVSAARWRQDPRATPPPPVYPLPPFAVEKYRLSEIVWDRDEWQLGPLRGRIETPGIAVEILEAPGSPAVHVVTENDTWQVLTIDPETMEERATRIELTAPADPPFRGPSKAAGLLQASVSPDGRYLVAGQGTGSLLNVADLLTREAWSLETPATRTVGTSFNRGWINPGLLALHHLDQVAVYRFHGRDPLEKVAEAPVWLPGAGGVGLVPSIAWSGSGDALIASALEAYAESEFAVFDLSETTLALTLRTRLATCRKRPNDGLGQPNVVLTTNGRLVPSPTPTDLPTPTATPTPSPTPTQLPRPIYLPAAIREECAPKTVPADVALVIDASSTMLEESGGGQSKMEAARAAAEQLLTLVGLEGGSQVAIVSFNEGAKLEHALSANRETLAAALQGIENREFTRIDLGIAAAREELAGPRHVPENRPVLILLTDGKANPVGPEAAVIQGQRAKEAGITVFAIGLGTPENLDDEALRQIASRTEYYYQTPDPDELTGIYEEIARAIPCPPESFWGGR